MSAATSESSCETLAWRPHTPPLTQEKQLESSEPLGTQQTQLHHHRSDLRRTHSPSATRIELRNPPKPIRQPPRNPQTTARIHIPQPPTRTDQPKPNAVPTIELQNRAIPVPRYRKMPKPQLESTLTPKHAPSHPLHSRATHTLRRTLGHRRKASPTN